MDFIDYIMVIAIVASVTFNILMYERNKKLVAKCAKEKARLLKFKADVKRQEANRLLVHEQSNEVDKDYKDGEKGYFFYDM